MLIGIANDITWIYIIKNKNKNYEKSKKEANSPL